MFYGGGLWSCFSQSCLDNHFGKSDFNIEMLLDEDNIINDVKMNQNKFSEFMIKNPQHLRELIRFAITMPSEKDTDCRKHKYPFISSELLGIQIPRLQEFFFSLKSKEEVTPPLPAETSGSTNLPENEAKNQSEQTKATTHIEEEEMNIMIEEKEPSIPDDTQQVSPPNETNSHNENLPFALSESQEIKKLDTPDEDEKPKKEEEIENNSTKKEEEIENKNTINEEEIENKNTNKEDEIPIKSVVEVEANKEIKQEKEHKDEDVKNVWSDEEGEEVHSSEEDEEASKPKVVPATNGDVSNQVVEKIDGQTLLIELFSFLDRTEEINSTSAGYFSKIVLQLISGKEGQNHTDVIENMFHHFYLKSVSKIVLSLITQEGIDLDPDLFLEQRKSLIQRLYLKFKESDDHEVLLNIQDIFVQVNCTSLRPQSFEVKRTLFSIQNMDILLESIQNHKESFSQASLILSSYLDHYRLTLFNDNSNEDSENYCSEGLNFGRKNDEAITKEFPLEYLQSKASCLIKALMEDNFNVEVPTHETQYGSIVQPFGLNRVKLLHLILCLLKIESETVNEAMVQNGFFTYLLNLIIKHEWNNILHNQIEQIYTESFKIAVHNTRVREAIINDADFLSFLVRNGLEFKTTPGTSKKQINKGYVCMLVTFANQIEEQKSKLPWLAEAVEKTPRWAEFVNGSLKSVNELHNKDLGNDDPRKRKDSEDSQQNSNDLSIKEIYMVN